jgi:hypothetical protein
LVAPRHDNAGPFGFLYRPSIAARQATAKIPSVHLGVVPGYKHR